MKKSDIRIFGLAGGDKRQLFLAKAISDSCYDVILGGFDKLPNASAIPVTDIKTTIRESDVVVFPLPSVRLDNSINTPFSEKTVTLDDEDISVLKTKPVFVSMSNKFLKAYPQLKDSELYDYSAKEEFAILNALPTAEGAIECAMSKFDGTIAGSKCLVLGYGRIGKILARLLSSLNAKVSVSARKPEDIAYIKALGYSACNTEKIKSVRGYDIVFNTIPALIFNKELLMNTDRNTLIIDLASMPGGVDFESAHRLYTDAFRALYLPGRCSPKTAGEIIKTTIFNIIEEVYR